MALYGRYAKLYGAALANNTNNANASAGFASAQFIKKIPIAYVDVDGSGNLNPAFKLFDPNFNTTSATLLDRTCSFWQQLPILFDKISYAGTVPVAQFKGLFPNLIDLSEYPSFNTFYVTDDDLTYVQWLGSKSTGQTPNMSAFNKSTLAESQYMRYISAAVFGVNYSGNNTKAWVEFIIRAVDGVTTYKKTGFGFANTSQVNAVWFSQPLTNTSHDFVGYSTNFAPSRDPYKDGGESGPDGGDGDFDFSSTDIPIPSNPSIGAMDTGFISLYAPSAGQLKSLANYMWAGAFDVTQFKKLFADPMDAILGLHIIPTISGHPATGSGSLLVGNIDTGLTMPTVTEQYYSADFGTVNIPAKWGAYLDYSPYTKLSLYLPYIGFVPISPDDCMRGSINVVYHVDILSGTCVAFVYCYSNRGADGHTLYIFNGSCSCDCPVTSGQYRSALEGLLGVAGSIGRVAAGDVSGGLKDAISNVTAMLKPEIGRSGSFGGAGGLMGIQYPYLVLTVPRMCIPGQQNTFIGYPSFVTKTIGDLEGYTSIDVSHLNNMPCTQAETDEIISLLGEGVIL